MTRQKQQLEIPYESDLFLPGYSVKKLKKMYAAEKDPKARMRLLVFIWIKQGFNRRQVSQQLCIPYTNVCRWVNRAIQLGISGRYDFKRNGRDCKLDANQLKELHAYLRQSPIQHGFRAGTWFVKAVCKFIQLKFGITYDRRTVQRLMRRLKMTFRKPRPKHPKSASKYAQKRYKEEAHKKVIEYDKQGYAILAQDEATKIINKILAAAWYPEEMNVEVDVTLSQKGFVMFGALSKDKFHCSMYQNANSDNFIDFLKHEYRTVGKFVMFVDNASYHKSEKVKRFLEEMDGEIILEYLLPYTPQLNPVEIQWRVISMAIANTYFETVEDMMDQICKMMKSREIEDVKMFEYLMVQ